MSGHAIDPFLDAWAAQNGRDDPDLRMRVYRVLSCMPEGVPLADTLRAVLAWTAEDRARFDRLYAAFFRESLATAPPPEMNSSRALESLRAHAGHRALHAPSNATAEATYRASEATPSDVAVPVGAVALIMLALVATAGTLVRSCTDTPSGRDASVAPMAGDAGRPHARDAATEATVDGPVTPQPSQVPGIVAQTPVAAPAQAAPSTRGGENNTFLTRWIEALFRAVANAMLASWFGTSATRGPWWVTALLGAAASAMLASWFARKPVQRIDPSPSTDEAPEPITTSDTPETSEPDLRGKTPPVPFEAKTREALAWAAGFARAETADEFDVWRTVHRSARNVGVFTPVLRPRVVAGRVALVVPRVMDEIQSALVADVEAALVERNVPVTVVRHARTGLLGDVALVFVDARYPDRVPLRRWWRHPRVAAVELRDPWMWGDEVEALSVEGAEVRVYPPTGEGIVAALLMASRGLRSNPAVARRAEVDEDDVGAAFPLAAACALCAPCDLATVDALRRRFAPALPFAAVARIASMRGLHQTAGGWTFDTDLHDRLVDRVEPSFRAAVLAWQVDRLAAVVAPEGTRAASVLRRERALATLRRGRTVKDHVASAEAQRVLAPLMRDAWSRERLVERAAELRVTIAEEPTGRPSEPPAMPRRRGVALVGAIACGMGALWSLVAWPPETVPAPTGGVVVAVAPSGVASCPEGMVLIPGGTFQMGSPDNVGESDEHRQHPVHVATFCLDRTEETVAQFRAYWSDPHRATGRVGTVSYPSGHTIEVTDSPQPPDERDSCNWHAAPGDREHHPINCVDWATAQAACVARGGRLPTEAEWEYAARGGDARVYPWGDDPPREQLCWSGGGPPRAGTCEVGQFRAPNMAFGLDDMAGNVWEWVADTYARYAYAHHDSEGYIARDASGPSQSTESRVLRGGSWIIDSAAVVRAARRDGITPTNRNNLIGFRCVRGVIFQSLNR